MNQIKTLLQKILLELISTKQDDYNPVLELLIIDCFNTILELKQCTYDIIAIATYLIEVLEQKVELSDELFDKASQLKSFFLYQLVEYEALNNQGAIKAPLFNRNFNMFLNDDTNL